MRNWQIQTRHGFVLGVFKAESATGALDQYAESKGWKDWADYCDKFDIPMDFIIPHEGIDFRIIV